MPISSSYGQKGKLAQQPWNSTKSRRLSSSTQPTDAQISEKQLADSSSRPSNTRPRLIQRKTSVGSRPAQSAGTISLSKPLDTRKRSLYPKTLSSRRLLRRRETSPSFYQATSPSNKAFKRSNSDSLIKPCDSKRKIRREPIASRRIRNTFPRRFEGRASGTQNKAKKYKVNSEHIFELLTPNWWFELILAVTAKINFFPRFSFVFTWR